MFHIYIQLGGGGCNEIHVFMSESEVTAVRQRRLTMTRALL